ncbi:MAG TPA: histidine kinase [Flavisolibacter sp.]
MKPKNRYSVWKIFWVLLALYLFFGLLGILLLSIAPAVDHQVNFDELVSWRLLVNQCASLAFATAFFYYTLNRFYRLFAEKKPVSQFIPPAAIGIAALAVYNVLSYFFISQKLVGINIRTSELQDKMPVALVIFSFVFSWLFYLGISLLISYLTFLRDEKKQQKILEEQKMQLEIEKSQANFNFLKAQINPHFLHNTLNFLYAKSLPYSPELSEGILTLSDIMRYALSEGNAKDGLAPLKDEIEHMRNVIKINQLRFSNRLNVNFDVHGVLNGWTIIPFVLITLVENAFKHGDLKSPDAPIDIRLDIEDHKLVFYCRNKKKTGPKELSTGIGLDNIKKRLDLAYGKNYSLDVKDDSEFYTTQLTILKPHDQLHRN